MLGCLLLCAWLTTPARALPVIDSREADFVDLSRLAQYSVQPRDASWEQVLAGEFNGARVDTPPLLVSGQALWLRFRVDNSALGRPVRWALYHQSAHLDQFDLWTRDSGGDWRGRSVSSKVPFTQRSIAYRKLTLGHETPAGGATEVIVRFAYEGNEGLIAAAYLREWTAFHEHLLEEQLLHGLYFGILLSLMFLALLIGLVLRDSALLYYALFLFCTGALWALHNGFAYQYLWPDGPGAIKSLYRFAFLVFAISALQLTKAFLRTREFMPLAHWLLTAIQMVALVGILGRLLGEFRLFRGLAMLSMVVLVLLPVAAWVAHRRGVERVLWFAVSWVIYGAGVAFAIPAIHQGWMTSMSAQYLLQVISLVQALVLSLAMAQRLLHLDRDRLRALEMAHQDPLTGLGNRRLLVQEYDAMRLRFHRDGTPVYLILFDIDHFKAINDRHGHDAGDMVIAGLATLLRRFSRGGDVCVRLGGEEFALLLNADNDAVPWQIAERIRTQFAAHPTRYGDGEVIEHTLSAGIARVMAGDEEQGFRAMLALADDALYQAKASGRNCTLFARNL